LDLSQDNDLIQDSKLLKNLTIEKLQENNNSIKVQIPKDTLVKKSVSQNLISELTNYT
jgi:hypothetical protein